MGSCFQFLWICTTMLHSSKHHYTKVHHYSNVTVTRMIPSTYRTFWNVFMKYLVLPSNLPEPNQYLVLYATRCYFLIGQSFGSLTRTNANLFKCFNTGVCLEVGNRTWRNVEFYVKILKTQGFCYLWWLLYFVQLNILIFEYSCIWVKWLIKNPHPCLAFLFSAIQKLYRKGERKMFLLSL